MRARAIATDQSSVELRDYFAILRQRKGSLLAVVLLVFAGALAYSFQQTPIFESQAQVLVKQTAISSNPTDLVEGPNLETERELAQSEAVGAIVAEREGGRSDQLLSKLSVDWTINTEILTFRYEGSNPVKAQRYADAFADAYLDYRRRQALNDLLAASGTVQGEVQKLNEQLRKVNARIRKTSDVTARAALQTQANSLIGQLAILQQKLAEVTPPDQLRVGQVVSPAELPSSASSPNHLRNGLTALGVGLILGALVALLRERLDDRLRGREDLELIGASPVLAAVPRVPGWKNQGRPVLVALTQPKSAAAESYKTLRTGFLFSAAERDAKVIMVTSPHAAEGKTVTTANLGVALAQSGKRVILVSADLRKPRLHHFFGLANHTGLTNVLGGEVSPWQALRDTGVEHLQMMPSGPVPENPAEMLGSNEMGRLLSVPSEMADYVLVDSAPVLAVADAATLAPLTDAVLLVADAQSTHRGAVEQARRQLEQVNAQIIGAVLNNFDPSKAGAYSYYRYIYRYEVPAQVQPQEEAEERTNVLRWRSGTKG
jgi:capsular exopolysaccharide synthesis family protein